MAELYSREALQAARLACLDDLEQYFNAPDGRTKISYRNEAAALSLILHCLKTTAGVDETEVQSFIESEILPLHRSLPAAGAAGQPCTSEADTDLLRWAQQRGITSNIRPAHFGSMRGAAAPVDIAPYDVAISVPESCLITAETAAQSDIGQALAGLGLHEDLILLVYTMVDREDNASRFMPFWRSLPAMLVTGLNAPAYEVDLLKGTPANLVLREARQHVRAEYQAALPVLQALLAAFPEHIMPEQVSEERFLWACSLWYSYAMEVQLTDGKLHQCLVPVATLMNHSAAAHIVRYGTVDAATGLLCFRAFRPCRRGEQVFLSYGALPNLKLLVFYGFAPQDNPQDTVSITLEMPCDNWQSQRQALIAGYDLALEHHVRRGPLPTRLLACMRILTADAKELDAMQRKEIDPFQVGSGESCMQTALLSCLSLVKESYIQCLAHCSPANDLLGRSGFEIALATFVDGQLAILDCSIEQCQRLAPS